MEGSKGQKREGNSGPVVELEELQVSLCGHKQGGHETDVAQRQQ